MIHPHTELRKVSDLIGSGVFATLPIPKGTIMYVKDPLEVEIPPLRYSSFRHTYKSIVDRYSYIDPQGARIVSWDIAKFVNHHCDCNTISTGYSFEIAIRDIAAGEEITDEYGLFNLPEELLCGCQSPHCRKIISCRDWDLYKEQWDRKALDGLSCLKKVPQPLIHYMDQKTRRALNRYLRGMEPYTSVLALRSVSVKSRSLKILPR